MTKKTRTTKSFFGGLLLLVSACSATGPQYSPSVSQARKDSERSARLVLYRGNSLMAPFGMTRVAIDNIYVGGVADAGFNYYDVTPGTHRIVVDHEGRPGECKLQINALSGQTAYFKIELRDAAGAALLLSAAGPLGAVAALAVEGSGDQCAGTWEIRKAGPEAEAELKRLKETQGNG